MCAIARLLSHQRLAPLFCRFSTGLSTFSVDNRPLRRAQANAGPMWKFLQKNFRCERLDFIKMRCRAAARLPSLARRFTL
jgi:hypothetical protein